MAPVFYFAAGQITFTLKYDGKPVTGLVGSSLNFTWSFSGDVDSVSWGLKKDGAIVIKNDGILVSLDKNGPVSVAVPKAYTGRVSGSGDASSGQVTFTLTSIRMSDKGFYACTLNPTSPFDKKKYDSVYLAVKGEHVLALSSDTILLTGRGMRVLSCKCVVIYTATDTAEIEKTCLKC